MGRAIGCLLGLILAVVLVMFRGGGEPITKSYLVKHSDVIALGYISDVACTAGSGNCSGYVLSFQPDSLIKGSLSGPVSVNIGKT